MSARVDITDRESLKAWLEDQPHEVVLFISTRAALRLIPVVWYWAGFDKSGRFDIGSKLSFDELLLEYLHAALITHIGCAPKDTSSPSQISAMKIAMIDPAPNSVLLAHDALAISCRLFEQHDPISDASRTLAACSQSLQQLGDVLPASPGNPYLKNLEETDAVSEWVNDHDNWVVRKETHDLRLWHAHNPLTPLWDILRRGTPHTGPTDDIFSTAPSDWQFWIEWYDSLLDGRPMLGDAGRTWEMLEKIALIDPATWDKGPEAVNPVIREIYEGYRAGSQIELFKATLYDFRFDQMAHVMRAIPMPEDWETLTDPDRLSRFLRDTLDLREDMGDLCDAFAAEGAGMQGAGLSRTYLGKVMGELENAETLGALRVGKLVEWGRILEATALREDTKQEFGAMAEPFGMLVDKLKGLMRDHFASTLARFSRLRDVRMEADAPPWEVLKMLREIVSDVRGGNRGAMPPLAQEDVAVLDDVLDSIDRMLRELEHTGGEDARSGLKREIDFQMAKVAATAGLYSEKAKNAVGATRTGADAADEVLKWDKRGRGLWSLLRTIWKLFDGNG